MESTSTKDLVIDGARGNTWGKRRQNKATKLDDDRIPWMSLDVTLTRVKGKKY